MQTNLRFGVYLRKSTDSEDKQQASIAAQRLAIEQLVARDNHTVVREYEESKSAKRPGREMFNAMMKDLERGEINAVVCWHLDRLARNSVDGGLLIWYLSEGTIQRIVTPHDVYRNNSDAKLIMQIKFGMAEKYVDDLSQNIRRGNKQACIEGRWPNRPPIGYVRVDQKSKELGPDPERFERVQEIWRLRLLGTPVLEILRRTHRWGLTMPRYESHGGRKLSSSQLYKLLQNPFYAGRMRYGGELYSGSHPAMISWAEFEHVQTMFETDRGRTLKPKTKTDRFLYTGLFRCGRCQAAITAERTRNRHGKTYIHYHCCRKNKRYKYCPERSVQESMITEALRAAIDGLTIEQPVIDRVHELLSEGQQTEEDRRREQESRLRIERGKLTARKERLISMCEDGAISSAELTNRRSTLQFELTRVDDQLQKLGQAASLIEPFQALISGLSQAKETFDLADGEDKRAMARWLFSNLEISSRKVLYRPKNIFQMLAGQRDVPSLCRDIDDVRSELLLINGQPYCSDRPDKKPAPTESPRRCRVHRGTDPPYSCVA